MREMARWAVSRTIPGGAIVLRTLFCASLFGAFGILAAGSLACAGEPAGFPFTDDKAGQMLSKLLALVEPGATRAGSAGPQRRTPLSRIDNPEVPLAPVSAEAPRSKPRPAAQTKPRPLPEGPPLDKLRQDPLRPKGVELPPGTRIRLQSVDVNQPLPLPILGSAQPDRASLTDPTTEASRLAALQNMIPERTGPAPFVRINLPDPFEHTHAVRLRTPPPESAAPPPAEPRRPNR